MRYIFVNYARDGCGVTPQTHLLRTAAEPLHDRWARQPLTCSVAEIAGTRGCTKSDVHMSPAAALQPSPMLIPISSRSRRPFGYRRLPTLTEPHAGRPAGELEETVASYRR